MFYLLVVGLATSFFIVGNLFLIGFRLSFYKSVLHVIRELRKICLYWRFCEAGHRHGTCLESTRVFLLLTQALRSMSILQVSLWHGVRSWSWRWLLHFFCQVLSWFSDQIFRAIFLELAFVANLSKASLFNVFNFWLRHKLFDVAFIVWIVLL